MDLSICPSSAKSVPSDWNWKFVSLRKDQELFKGKIGSENRQSGCQFYIL